MSLKIIMLCLLIVTLKIHSIYLFSVKINTIDQMSSLPEESDSVEIVDKCKYLFIA